MLFLCKVRKDGAFMSIREEDELFLFAEELQRCMSPAVLNQLAKETKYMIRKRKCHGQHFLALCIVKSESGEYFPCPSL
ncbi:hypothetical protein TS64_04720 [Aneurinibacillus migulanus]|nr:hypothetical protein TS64_04720 [Aneurinibacillus migulanus]